jgi:regulator of RNase E activity RraA
MNWNNRYKESISTALKVCTLIFIICSAANAQEKLSDKELLKLYEGLRVADVSDGMDMVGLRDVGIMVQEIEPLWRDIENFSHIVRGIAITARYVPSNKVVRNPMKKEEFQKWESDWYSNISTEPFVDSLTASSVIVLDARGDGDTGSMGSLNGLYWVSKGAKGVVTNGAVRDTDEIIKENIPVYLDHANRGRGIRPGRNEIESVNETVVVGGVQVNPGDVIVADGDGVIVVPRKHAKQVAEYAQEILRQDKQRRRSLYNELGMPLDQTVQPDSVSNQ